jgi:predicted DNA-binding ArsR family transcriptional regulator
MNKKESVAIEKMLQALKVLGGNNNTSQALLAEAERELKLGNEPTRLTGNIEFECPQHTLRVFLNQLRVDNVKAQYGTHYREINGRTEINIEKDSYMIDENDKGSLAVDELRAKNSKATDAEIEDAYKEGCEKARRHNRKAKTVEPQWVMAEKDGESDTREEDTNIRYIDIQRTRIDWYVSIRNLAAYGKRTGYNMNHCKRCIDRWVSFFSPHLRPVTDSQSAKESASYLSVLTLPDNNVEIFERAINKMVRQPGEKLVSVMSNLRALANVMDKEYDQLEREINVERTLLQGVIMMTAGKTRSELEAALLEKKRSKEKINWNDLLDGVVRSEEIHGMPREPFFSAGFMLKNQDLY